MTTKTTTDLRLAVRFEDSPYNSFGDHYCHVYVMPVVMARGKYGDQRYEAHNVDSYDIDVPASVSALKGLRVKAQMDDRSGYFYGYRVHFDIDQLTLDEGERALPILRRLDKRMTALSDQFGYPRDIVQFLAHLANAMGLAGKPFVTRVTDEADYEGHGHRSRDVDSLRLAGRPGQGMARAARDHRDRRRRVETSHRWEHHPLARLTGWPRCPRTVAGREHALACSDRTI